MLSCMDLYGLIYGMIPGICWVAEVADGILDKEKVAQRFVLVQNPVIFWWDLLENI